VRVREPGGARPQPPKAGRTHTGGSAKRGLCAAGRGGRSGGLAERRSGIRQPEGRRGAARLGAQAASAPPLKGSEPSGRAGKSRRAVSPCGFPPLAVFLLKGGIRKGGFQGGETEGGNSLAGAARRVKREPRCAATVQVRPSAAEHRLGGAPLEWAGRRPRPRSGATGLWSGGRPAAVAAFMRSLRRMGAASADDQGDRSAGRSRESDDDGGGGPQQRRRACEASLQGSADDDSGGMAAEGVFGAAKCGGRHSRKDGCRSAVGVMGPRCRRPGFLASGVRRRR